MKKKIYILISIILIVILLIFLERQLNRYFVHPKNNDSYNQQLIYNEDDYRTHRNIGS